jgi:hypothetical protein
VFDKALRRSVEDHLDEGEELLSLTTVQGKGMTRWLLAGGVAGQTAAGAVRNRRDGATGSADGGVALASKMALAITPRRLLLFKAGGAVTVKAQELLTDIPIGEVDAVACGKAAMSKPLVITVHGDAIEVEAPKAVNTKKVVEAFEQAKAGAAAVA